MILRPYQHEAVASVYAHLREHDDNPCVVIPTAGGKTPILATICRDAVDRWGGRVLVLAHVKELLEQAADKLRAIAPQLPVGVYSAGLGRRDLGYAVTIAGIQSIYKRADALGPLDLVIVDEAHLIAPDGDGMYRQFFEGARAVNPNLRIIGLTATPFRMKSGTICSSDGILNTVCYEIGVRELIVQGYLCPLRSKAGVARADTSGLHTRAGEYIASEVEDLMDADWLVEAACKEIVEQTGDRRSVLIFAAGVEHGRHIATVLGEKHGVECGFVCGDTPARERSSILDRFKRGALKHLANVNVLTTGFDAPNIDCVVMLRPTLSPGLYYQMVGRGFRLAPGKTDCLVLDFGGNVLRHGPVDALGDLASGRSGQPGEAPAKECPTCHELVHAAYAVCPACGHAFPPPERTTHEATAGTEGVLSGQKSREEYRVIETRYQVHYKAGNPDAPPTMRVEYCCGFNKWIREWVCFEHSGYARDKAEHWWSSRSHEPVPDTIEEAVEMACAGALAETTRITVEHTAGSAFDRVVHAVLGDKPPRLDNPDNLPVCADPDGSCGFSLDDIPF